MDCPLYASFFWGGGLYQNIKQCEYSTHNEIIGFRLFYESHLNVMFLISIDPWINDRECLVIKIRPFCVAGVRVWVWVTACRKVKGLCRFQLKDLDVHWS